MKGIFVAPSCQYYLRKIADEFKDLLGSHYRAFVATLFGHLMGISSSVDVVRFLMFSPSVSDINRFLNEKDLALRLSRRQRRMVEKIFKLANSNPNRYIWAFDDTILPHTGKNIWGAYYWHDHCSNSTIWGHKLLVLGLVDTVKNIFIPVKWEILHREKSNFVDGHEKGWEVGIRLLNEARKEGFTSNQLVADSWFACEEAFEKLTLMGIKFTMEIKSNRIVEFHKKRRIGNPVNHFFKDIKRTKISFRGRPKWASSATLRFRNSRIKLKTVAVANKKGLSHEPFSYYVCNQLTWDKNKIWSLARFRWSIEGVPQKHRECYEQYMTRCA